jgi:hypothetical protein
LVIASVVSIGHLSTVALAAATLASMTASVSGFSIIQGIHKHPGHDASQRVDFSPAPACGLVVTANGSVEVVLCREQYAEPVFSDRYGRHAYCGYISSNHWYDDLIFIVRSPCLEFGLTRKKYFFFSSKTRKSPTSEVSISNGCRLGFRLMHLTVYLGMYHFLVLLINNHVTEFCEDDISNPKVCQVLTGKLTRSLFEGFRVVYCAHTDHLSRGSNQRFAELCPG